MYHLGKYVLHAFKMITVRGMLCQFFLDWVLLWEKDIFRKTISDNSQVAKFAFPEFFPFLPKSFSLTVYREPETSQNARPFRSSMAERQRFGYLDTWPYNCKQTASLRSPISKWHQDTHGRPTMSVHCILIPFLFSWTLTHTISSRSF